TVQRGQFDAQTWQAGVGVDDLLIPGSQLAAAVGMPFINSIDSPAAGVNDEEQINIEAFYRFPVNDNITISPIFSAILNPNNSSAESDLYQGLIRVVFSF
ncbi:MAG: carbohydrate porin, partial [Cyanobacteria bacterium P01_A01_bin.17]